MIIGCVLLQTRTYQINQRFSYDILSNASAQVIVNIEFLFECLCLRQFWPAIFLAPLFSFWSSGLSVLRATKKNSACDLSNKLTNKLSEFQNFRQIECPSQNDNHSFSFLNYVGTNSVLWNFSSSRHAWEKFLFQGCARNCIHVLLKTYSRRTVTQAELINGTWILEIELLRYIQPLINQLR